ncbi:hypothetical protein BH18ACT10_BH18ACT10_17010 [soil metagenome]
MGVQDDTVVVRRFWEEVVGKNDIELMDELFSDNFKLHDLVYKERRRLQDLKGLVRDTKNAIPGINVEVVDQQLDVDGRVFTHFTVHVPRPEGRGYADANTPSDGWAYTGLSISRLYGGEIHESWVIWEAIRASKELSEPFGAGNWRWPPWR